MLRWPRCCPWVSAYILVFCFMHFFLNKVRVMQFIDSMSCLFSLSIAVYTLSDCIKRSYAYLAFTTCQALF